MTTHTKALDRAAQAILDRQDAERRERAMGQAREEIEREQFLKGRRETIERAGERLRALDRTAIDSSRAEALAALDKYAAEIVAWNTTIRETYDELAPFMVLEEAGPFQRDSQIEISPTGDLTVAGVTAKHEGLQRGLGDLAREVLDAHLPPRAPRSLDNPRD